MHFLKMFSLSCVFRLVLMLGLVLTSSLRYHNLNPNYIHDRLKQLGQTFTLRVLLVQVDVVSKKCFVILMRYISSVSSHESVMFQQCFNCLSNILVVGTHETLSFSLLGQINYNTDNINNVNY